MVKKRNMEADDGSDYDDFDFGEEPDFSDPDGFVDDITDEELMPEIMKNRPKETDGVESVIVVDGVPVVGGDRVEDQNSDNFDAPEPGLPAEYRPQTSTVAIISKIFAVFRGPGMESHDFQEKLSNLTPVY